MKLFDIIPKKIKNILKILFRRKPSLFFFSPDLALVKCYRQKKSNSLSQYLIINNIEKKLSNIISVHEDVISYPLQKRTGDSYYGGLVSSKSCKLIDEAILNSWNGPCQELSLVQAQDTFNKEIPTIEHTILFGGILFNHFGHFLLESISRLWAYELIKDIDPYICFYTPWGIPKYLEKNNYINQVLTGFRLPCKKIVFINDLVNLKQVIVPFQKYGFGYASNPDSVFVDFINSFRFQHDLPKAFKNADRIYVSRSKLPINSARLIGEDIFEEYLRSNGYKILYPERYSLFQQLTIYSQAKKIIFCEGSSAHACILTPHLQADVAVVARRKDLSACSHFIEQFKGYGKDISLIYSVREQYQFGTGNWNALADIDWYKASILLEQQGFVNTAFESFNQLDYASLVRGDLQKYIQKISSNPQFIDFMINLKEK